MAIIITRDTGTTAIGVPLTNAQLDNNFINLNTELATKQATLVSGTSIKTVNSQSVLGSGNIQIDGGVTSFNTRTGAVTLGSSDVTGALTYIPVNKAGDTITGDLLNTAAYSAPNNATGVGTKLLIRGSTGTGAADSTGGNGGIEILGGGATSIWGSFGGNTTRGGILVQSGTAQADAGNTYVAGSALQLRAGAGTNNGTQVGFGGTITIYAGNTTKTDGNTSSGGNLTLWGGRGTQSGYFALGGGVIGFPNFASSQAGGINTYPGTATEGGETNITSGSYSTGAAQSYTNNSGGLIRLTGATATTGGDIAFYPGSVYEGIAGGVPGQVKVNNSIILHAGNYSSYAQPLLVSGTTIKTINGTSVLGSGNIVITAGSTGVTSVAALTLASTGTDITSTVENGTTTPVITLNIPTASATNRGALSATDWSTFNNKQAAGTYATGTGSASGTNTGDQTIPTTLPNANAVTFTTSGGAVAGSTYTGAAVLTVDYSTVGAAASGHTHSYQAADADLLAIGGLTGTTGLLKKTDVDTWTLDTTAYTTNTGTVTGVTATAPVASTGGTAPVISMAAASSGVNGYMTGAYATKLDGIASGATNVTNNNQLTNGAGYTTNTGTVTGVTATTPIVSSGGTAPVITHATSGVGAGTYNNVTVDTFGHVTSGSNTAYLTGYTETDTLASVTGRGATTSTAISLTNTGTSLSIGGSASVYQSITFGDSSRYSAVSTTIQNAGAGDKLILFNQPNYDARILVGTNYDFLFKSQGNSVGLGIYKFYSGASAALAMTIDGYQNVTVAGTLFAASKSFLIPHPTKPGMKLRYGSLEGPENGVYIRGKLKGKNKIELPEYWTKLVDPDSITVTLTPVGKHQKLYVEDIADNTVTIANDGFFAGEINCFFVVYGERVDIDKLVVESE